MFKRKIKRSLDGILVFLMGEIRCQAFYEGLSNSLLDLMNFGGGSYPVKSGEAFVLDYIRVALKKENNAINIFDVGANTGSYAALLWNKFKDTNAAIFSFEPSVKAYQELKEVLGYNASVKLYNFGFGEKNEQVILYSDKQGSAQGSLYNLRLEHFNIEMKHQEMIQIRTIDDFCQENHVDRIHFLKLDVEGHELKVLKGAQNLIAASAIDFIQFEFGGCNIGSRTYFQDFFYLLNPKYRIYRILKNGLYPIEQYKPTYEIFLTTNYLAVKRS